MASAAMRARYLADTIATASPARLVILLYDRLAVDLEQAERALREGDRPRASALLQHAQEIVLELTGSLDTSGWSGAEGLAQLYGYLFTELVQANVRADADRVAAAAALLAELGEAWRGAAAQAGGAQAGAVQAGGAGSGAADGDGSGSLRRVG